jgi:hypothetical protein
MYTSHPTAAISSSSVPAARIKASKLSAGKQRVSFKKRCNVILIPCRQEYLDYDISLWNDPERYGVAKNEVFNDISMLMDQQPNLNFREVVTLLFQPENICVASKRNIGSALQLQSPLSDTVFKCRKLDNSPKSVSDAYDTFFIGDDHRDSECDSNSNIESFQLTYGDTDRSTF